MAGCALSQLLTAVSLLLASPDNTALTSDRTLLIGSPLSPPYAVAYGLAVLGQHTD